MAEKSHFKQQRVPKRPSYSRSNNYSKDKRGKPREETEVPIVSTLDVVIPKAVSDKLGAKFYSDNKHRCGSISRTGRVTMNSRSGTLSRAGCF
jgi:hypothetical protein